MDTFNNKIEKENTTEKRIQIISNSFASKTSTQIENAMSKIEESHEKGINLWFQKRPQLINTVDNHLTELKNEIKDNEQEHPLAYKFLKIKEENKKIPDNLNSIVKKMGAKFTGTQMENFVKFLNVCNLSGTNHFFQKQDRKELEDVLEAQKELIRRNNEFKLEQTKIPEIRKFFIFATAIINLDMQKSHTCQYPNPQYFVQYKNGCNKILKHTHDIMAIEFLREHEKELKYREEKDT